MERSWGGPIDVSADHLPFFSTKPGTRIHYGAGYSGHGVGPSWLGGQILASLALGADDEWTRLPLATRHVPSLPPEPFRRSAAGSCASDHALRGGGGARGAARRSMRERAPLSRGCCGWSSGRASDGGRLSTCSRPRRVQIQSQTVTSVRVGAAWCPRIARTFRPFCSRRVERSVTIVCGSVGSWW